ncbi:hypothetical protein DFP72DRAFT_859379 [Ephemerocybe angulata]|uniref:Uncharacterized protein n=1 Tax=Ephemerocybe angulata TaxID=980116 RepID=A0A8H6HA05_9AGAR|nr:hypothetical protein DFP72DRAFT_859379 [Tulosesus angulatus]
MALSSSTSTVDGPLAFSGSSEILFKIRKERQRIVSPKHFQRRQGCVWETETRVQQLNHHTSFAQPTDLTFHVPAGHAPSGDRLAEVLIENGWGNRKEGNDLEDLTLNRGECTGLPEMEGDTAKHGTSFEMWTAIDLRNGQSIHFQSSVLALLDISFVHGALDWQYLPRPIPVRSYGLMKMVRMGVSRKEATDDKEEGKQYNERSATRRDDWSDGIPDAFDTDMPSIPGLRLSFSFSLLGIESRDGTTPTPGSFREDVAVMKGSCGTIRDPPAPSVASLPLFAIDFSPALAPPIRVVGFREGARRGELCLSMSYTLASGGLYESSLSSMLLVCGDHHMEASSRYNIQVRRLYDGFVAVLFVFFCFIRSHEGLEVVLSQDGFLSWIRPSRARMSGTYPEFEQLCVYPVRTGRSLYFDTLDLKSGFIFKVLSLEVYIPFPIDLLPIGGLFDETSLLVCEENGIYIPVAVEDRMLTGSATKVARAVVSFSRENKRGIQEIHSLFSSSSSKRHIFFTSKFVLYSLWRTSHDVGVSGGGTGKMKGMEDRLKTKDRHTDERLRREREQGENAPYSASMAVQRTTREERHPDQWNSKVRAQATMRTTFVWFYLKAKYSMTTSRSTVSSRIFREVRRMKEEGLVTEPNEDELFLPSTVANDPTVKNATKPTASCYRVAYWIEYDSFQDRFRVQGAPPPPYTPLVNVGHTFPPPHYIPLSPTFVNVKLFGDLFGTGHFEVTAPWAHAREGTARLLHSQGHVLRKGNITAIAIGQRYEKATVCRLPPAFFVGLGISDLQGATITVDLDLNDHGTFLMKALNTVLPRVQPVTHLLLTFRFPENLETLRRSYVAGIQTTPSGIEFVYVDREPQASPEVPVFINEDSFSFPDFTFVELAESYTTYQPAIQEDPYVTTFDICETGTSGTDDSYSDMSDSSAPGSKTFTVTVGSAPSSPYYQGFEQDQLTFQLRPQSTQERLSVEVFVTQWRSEARGKEQHERWCTIVLEN